MSKPRVCYAEHNRAPRNLSPTRGFGGGGAKPRPARGLLDQHHRDRLLPERLSPAIDERDPEHIAIKGLRGLGKLEGQPLLLALLEREQGGHLAAGNRAEPGTNVGLGLVPPTDPKLRARRQSRERHAPETGSVEPSGTPGDPPEPRHHQRAPGALPHVPEDGLFAIPKPDPAGPQGKSVQQAIDRGQGSDPPRIRQDSPSPVAGREEPVRPHLGTGPVTRPTRADNAVVCRRPVL